VLFDVPIETKISTESKTIERNLKNEARGADMLMIWTDCDREGEHIGSEIATVCQKAKRNIIVKRARFSAIIAQYVSSPLSITEYSNVHLDKFIMPHNIP
jgi:DNA topoisomerase-3